MALEVKNERYRAILRQGRAELQCISEKRSVQDLHQNSVFFPQKKDSCEITCVSVTMDFFIYGTNSGSIVYYYVDDRGPSFINEYRNYETGIQRLWPNKLGTRLLFEDDHHSLYIYNPLNDQTLLVPDFNGILETALWDTCDSQLFVLAEYSQIYVFLYSQINLCCPKVVPLGGCSRSIEFYPLTLQDGILTSRQWCHGGNNSTYPCLAEVEGDSQIRNRFNQNIALLHFKAAWNDAILLEDQEIWETLIRQSLEHMEVEVALQSCQRCRDLNRFMFLNQIEHIEDRHLLAGHILVLLEDYDAAQEALLRSSNPEAALTMRKNLKHWDQALQLAIQLCSPYTSELKWEYAQVLERKQQYEHSLAHYEDFLSSNPSNPKQCLIAKAGVARTCLRVGDIWKGKQIAAQCDSPFLYAQCAKIMEDLSLLQDAAEFYEMGGSLENATQIYIKTKNYSKAHALLQQQQSSKLQIEYGKAMEAESIFVEASAAYEAAGDVESVVRLHLGPLKNPRKAFSALQKLKSIGGAIMAAKYCKSVGDYAKAIEFFIMANRTEEARELAEQHNKMDIYTELVVDVASKDECLRLARYYETMELYGKAGELFERWGESKQALQLYLRWGTPDGMEQAIKIVGRLKCDTLTHEILEFLTKDTAGEKSPWYLFQLYTVLQQYEQATKAALTLACQEQEAGNYKNAHQLLFGHCRVLQEEGKTVPSELSMQLMLLHSYVLVKILMRLDDHRSSARLLIRIASHISKFPSHTVPILISTVVECQRSGLKRTAFEYASTLMSPEYRQLIPSLYKLKIEKIVRKPDKIEDEEPLSPCPACSVPISETQLDCPSCKYNIPFCIATGRHMVLGDWTICPLCKFPALMSEFVKVLQVEGMCPMCSQNVPLVEVKPLENIQKILQFNEKL
ncbi:hypothetical protein O6H91_04G007600 [Diphasiastrum complanatum]|uniref:Uncharacterized protein n=1 Tax=Diphasiastrum complanatum TaxID=34168 RepID=A0ACC2DU17_DIPCM|nr:hypothetical protein O6H91_04G007600 [Diphasiastrum complanatum]